MLGPTATQEQVDMLNESLGVNRPLLVRYGEYIWNALHGDFGTSYTFNVPVTSVLMPKFPTTLKLAVLSVVFSALLGIPLGILSAVKKHSLLDHMLTVIALFLASVPGFWLGLMLMLFLSLQLGLLPSSGVGTWQHFVMPVMTLALPSAAFISRIDTNHNAGQHESGLYPNSKRKGCKGRKSNFWTCTAECINSSYYTAGNEFCRITRRCHDHRNCFWFARVRKCDCSSD